MPGFVTLWIVPADSRGHYRMEILFGRDEVSYYCACPAFRNADCKHIAGFLQHLRQLGEEAPQSPMVRETPSVEAWLAQLEETQAMASLANQPPAQPHPQVYYELALKSVGPPLLRLRLGQPTAKGNWTLAELDRNPPPRSIYESEEGNARLYTRDAEIENAFYEELLGTCLAPCITCGWIHPNQKTLYETIRASMDDRVREAIAEKGLARSSIIVIDAMLKLRQICCHPKLLKMETTKKIRKSAKLDRLLQPLGHLAKKELEL